MDDLLVYIFESFALFDEFNIFLLRYKKKKTKIFLREMRNKNATKNGYCYCC